MPDEKVLLVDDEEDFTRLLAERLEARGLQVEVATSGSSALERVQGESYDVIVLDLAMPGMDGIETLKRLHEQNPDLQIILLTGPATLQKGVEAMKLGAREVLEKPADMETLLTKISEAKLDRVMLVEKRMEERIRKLLTTKGW
jgi:DNA-binding NtrC family response regulator